MDSIEKLREYFEIKASTTGNLVRKNLAMNFEDESDILTSNLKLQENNQETQYLNEDLDETFK